MQRAGHHGHASVPQSCTCRCAEEVIDLSRLQKLALKYAVKAGANQAACGVLEVFLNSKLVAYLVGSGVSSGLYSGLTDDVYKPRMHRVYAQHLQACTVAFVLNVRHTPSHLKDIRESDPLLFSEFLSAVSNISKQQPLPKRTRQILYHYFHGFITTEAMVQRAEKYGVAPVTWQDISGNPTAFAEGKAEAASHVETSLTQAVQQCTILAQISQIQRQHGYYIDRTERIANSLGHLAAVLGTLNTHLESGKEALFAGRRSSDRLYLLLQNAFCAHALSNYGGTSSIYVVEHIDAALHHLSESSNQHLDLEIGPLVGTHAHELMSIFAQLLAVYDEKAGGVQVSALVAHLLFIREAGTLEGATALADTFGTAAFIAAACAAKLDDRVAADLASQCSADIPQGTVVFDLFRHWRMDSGNYATEAEHVIATWERRCSERRAANLPPLPKPALMHSNFSSVDEVVAASRLPERIRPSVLAFGTLADGYTSFDLPDGTEVEVQLASVVMKCVQASVPGVKSALPCTGKLGDGADMSKAQVDPRLSHDAQQKVRKHMLHMAQQVGRLDSNNVSMQLNAAYEAVVFDKMFCRSEQT